MWIEIRAGARAKTTLELTRPLVIGRDETCDLVLDDPKASRRHATLTPLPDGTTQLEDLNSTNGTYVNGHRIDTPTTLHGDELLRIADTPIALTRHQPRTAPATTPATPPPQAPTPPATPSRIERLALRRSARRVQLVAGAALAVALAGLAVGLLFATGTLGGSSPPAVSDIVREAEASVVQIRTVAEDGTSQADGSGWVYDAANGLVVTNAHVVNAGTEFSIRLGREQRDRPAKVVGVAGCEDLAVLQVEDTAGMRSLEPGTQAGLRRGDTVISVGYPGTYAAGDPLVVVTGIVSLVRTQTDDGLYQNVIQTDLAQNPGNSGGALLDDRGRLVGVTTLGEVGTALEGQRYSIGVDRVRKVVPELAGGRSLAWSGMAFYPAGGLDLTELGLPQADGLLVTNVVAGSPAAEAGIAAPALVLAVDGQVYADEVTYCQAYRNAAPGQEAAFSILPSGASAATDVTLPVG